MPDSLDLITPYVLREQEQWFEAEVPFIRKLLRPGMAVIDIGANYGCYALVMARGVGDRGHVWAFEPASSTAEYLAASITANELGNLTLIQAALSDRAGTARLFINSNTELNSLTYNPGGTTEEVRMMTLDQCRMLYGWEKIDFVKLDAEGEEGRILSGGVAFLTEQSPLFMFELKHGTTVNALLIEQFAAQGYHAYRLVPGQNILVPFLVDEEIDSFQLNLFCCKEDRATTLQEQGLLVADAGYANKSIMVGGDSWQERLFAFPYAARFWRDPEIFTRFLRHEGFEEYMTGIRCFIAAYHEGISPSERYCALRQSLRHLEAATENNRHFSRLCSYARVAGELGERGSQVKILKMMLDIMQVENSARLDEPFIPASPRFDNLDPVDRHSDWFIASLFEQWESQHAFSSYYTGLDALSVLENIGTSGFQSAEMERRLQLVRMRAGTQAGPVQSPLLSVRSATNLNPDYWAAWKKRGR